MLKYLNVLLYHDNGVTNSNIWVLNFFFAIGFMFLSCLDQFEKSQFQKKVKKNPGFGAYFWQIFEEKTVFEGKKKF